MNFNNYCNINRSTGLYTDMYELAMAQAYFTEGTHNQTASFDYFFRKIPYSGGYVIFCGLSDLLKVIENLRFDKEDIDFLKKQGLAENFLSWLQNFRFKGSIFSMKEGEVVFPTEPVLRVEGN